MTFVQLSAIEEEGEVATTWVNLDRVQEMRIADEGTMLFFSDSEHTLVEEEVDTILEMLDDDDGGAEPEQTDET